MKFLVTGCCGFIAKYFVCYVLENYDIDIVGYDKLTYCSDKRTPKNDRFTLIIGDICDTELVLKTLKEHEITHIIHFAAETHVCHSFTKCDIFIQSNIIGTHSLLKASVEYGKLEKFIHISTDEVYGSNEYSKSNEKSLLDPTNPYSASKAAAEMMVKAYYYSFKLPMIIIRPNNAYGPGQYFEKLIQIMK